MLISMHITRILTLLVFIKHINALFCMTYSTSINPTQCLNLTTTLLTINKQKLGV